MRFAGGKPHARPLMLKASAGHCDDLGVASQVIRALGAWISRGMRMAEARLIVRGRRCTVS